MLRNGCATCIAPSHLSTFNHLRQTIFGGANLSGACSNRVMRASRSASVRFRLVSQAKPRICAVPRSARIPSVPRPGSQSRIEAQAPGGAAFSGVRRQACKAFDGRGRSPRRVAGQAARAVGRLRDGYGEDRSVTRKQPGQRRRTVSRALLRLLQEAKRCSRPRTSPLERAGLRYPDKLHMPDGSSTAHLYRPKLATVLDEGYNAETFRKDLAAALTVAVVALPLSMAIAVASGVGPERGLYAAIVGGFLVSALGGSRFQIGGPAGAFIVLVSAAAAKFGVEGLLIAVFLSGLMLLFIGLARVGALIRYIPHAVTVGFTCGIAVTILASQLRDLGGLVLTTPEPGPLPEKLVVLGASLGSLSLSALAVGLGSASLIFALRAWRPTWPGMLIAVAIASVATYWLSLPIATIGSHFGGVPNGLPAPRLPSFTTNRVFELLPTALSFTLLGGVESLLSAKVADGMTGRKHRYNMELVAQGIANIASAIFGGISVTGTIARTATNIRAGARSPLSGMMHSIFVLLFMLVGARLANFVPLSALAGVLVVVCWNMAERKEFIHLLGNWKTAVVLLATFGLTLVRDLTFGIVTGCFLAAAIALAEHSARALNRAR
jgi:sulfate permease, SulP family